ncbi:hypothetical protein Tco_1225843 [Tanacetum coccineum]
MRDVASAYYHSVHPSGTPQLLPIPLPAPSSSRRADVPEADAPPRKRLLLTTPRDSHTWDGSVTSTTSALIIPMELLAGKWLKAEASSVSISNCPATSQVKFATCTLQDDALTWWNAHVKTTTTEAAHAMPWAALKKMMTDNTGHEDGLYQE